MHRLSCPRIVLAVLVTVAGCGGGGGSAPDAASIEVDGDGQDGSDGSTLGGDDGPSSTVSHCPTEATVKGGPLARVRWANGIAFCIDSTEVTNAQYAAFLAADVDPAGTHGPRCAWNKSFTPETLATNGPPCPTFDSAARGGYPVVCVDWCDADAYCHWAGKHLCQKPGGGAVESVMAKDASEWVLACTGDGAGKYPYGVSATAGKCVDRQYPATAPGLRPVKEAVMCEGGVPGLFDMSGNAWEWQDDCVQKTGQGGDDACDPIGGSFSSEVASASCTDTTPFFRKQVAGDTGFRCCVDADFF
ncbi:MAG: SUMF1/EgtB/PvdO family nonheme iron enzyme [Myxococcales bacterium]